MLLKKPSTHNKNVRNPFSSLKQFLYFSLVFIPYVFLIIFSFATLSCTTTEPDRGTLILDITPTFQLSTILPNTDMTPASYDFSGSGPGGSTFNTGTDNPPVVIPGLEFGKWTVTVNAKNSSGTVIGMGEETVTIHTGNVQNVYIPVTPVQGYGTIDLAVYWNDTDTEFPSLQGQVIPKFGSPIDLSFNLGAPGEGTFTSDTIPTGYHTLVLQLLDNGILVMGAVEVVRIVRGQTTSGLFEFYNINKPGGDIEINITPEMSDPITVTMSGQEDVITEGSLMTVSASVPAEVGNVTFVWYVNGESKATGESFTVGGSLPLGIYRLDVTAFSADGTQAGSAMHTFSVVEPAQVTLIWDPNSESDLAGYKLYYGYSSRDYPNVIDVGNEEICIVDNLKPGETYYFAATAYNITGLESDYSNEVEYMIPL